MSNQPDVVGVGPTHGLERRSVIAALAAAGIAGPIIFTLVAIVQSLIRADHSLVGLPISALGAGPSGWVQDVNFLLEGALLVAYAIGLHLGVRPARLGELGPALLVLGGVGVMLAGVFPAVGASGAFSEEQVGHTVVSFMAFLGTGIGFIVLSWRLARDPRWRRPPTRSPAVSRSWYCSLRSVLLRKAPPRPCTRGWGCSNG